LYFSNLRHLYGHSKKQDVVLSTLKVLLAASCQTDRETKWSNNICKTQTLC